MGDDGGGMEVDWGGGEGTGWEGDEREVGPKLVSFLSVADV